MRKKNKQEFKVFRGFLKQILIFSLLEVGKMARKSKTTKEFQEDPPRIVIPGKISKISLNRQSVSFAKQNYSSLTGNITFTAYPSNSSQSATKLDRNRQRGHQNRPLRNMTKTYPLVWFFDFKDQRFQKLPESVM